MPIRFRGMFAPLRDPKEFGKVYIDEGGSTIEWNDQVNLDPVTLYYWVTGQPLPGSTAR
jgi:hypothetical protein